MSSPRGAETCDAVLRYRDAPVGPIRLPEVEVEAFLEEFNATYRPLGLEAVRVAGPPPTPEDPPRGARPA